MYSHKPGRAGALKQIYQFALILVFLSTLLASGPMQTTKAKGEEPAPPANTSLKAPLFAPPLASVTLNVPSTLQIGQAFSFTATFDNTDTTAPGYGPFIDIVFPVTGIDGYDGIDFVDATYLTTPVISVEDNFGTANTGGCVGGLGPVTHPYAVAPVTGAPLVVCGTPGDKLVTLLLPFGSFTPDQPPAVVTVNATLSNLADLADPSDPVDPNRLFLRARGGYQFGATPTSDWCCDPWDATIVSHSGPSTSWPDSPVYPTLLSLSKTYNGPEDETATGPNFPQQYTLTVDIADGQQVSALTLTDSIPNNMQFVGVLGTNPLITCTTAPTDPLIAPGGTLTCNFGTITGGPAANDAEAVFEFYIPLNNSGGNPVLDASLGDDELSQNTSSVTGDWDPIDGTDPDTTATASVCPEGCHDLTDKSIAIQKSVAMFNDVGILGYSPGDILLYTLEFQVSDFFTFDNISISDILSDGQRLTGTPTLSVTDRDGTFAGNFTTGGNLTVDNSQVPPAYGGTGACGDGRTRLTFDVSQARDDLGGSDGIITGGLVNSGAFGGATGVIEFRVVIQNDFACVFPSGDRSVDHGDLLGNDVTIAGEVLDNATQVPQVTPRFEEDTSGESFSIQFGTLAKSVFAVNLTFCEPCTNEISTIGVSPGDRLTFRLRYTQPSSDFEETILTDYLPLPIFDATTVTSFSNLVCGIPGSGSACLGPADDYHSLNTDVPAETNPVVIPTMSTDATNNSVNFTYPTYDSVTNTSTETDILFTVTLTNEPFADGLFLTNQANSSEGTTNSVDQVLNTIIQIKINEPLLIPTKSAVSTNSTAPGISFAPAIGGPLVFDVPGVVDVGVPDWSTDGTPGWTAGEVINSNYLDSNPIDADLTGIDGGDLVKYAIVIENRGSGIDGAFDIAIKDAKPPEFIIPGSGLNLEVFLGDGTLIAFGDVNAGNPGLFGDGIMLVDPGTPASGACQAHDDTNGQNVIIITYDLELSGSGVMNPDIINTTTLLSYSSSDGGPNFVPSGVTDTAEATPATPSLTKTLKSTSEGHTSNVPSPARVAIGEIVRYRLSITLPEGVFDNFQIDDNLPAGLVYLDDGTARAALISNGTTALSSASVGIVPALPVICVVTGNELTVIPDPLPCALDDLNIGIDTSILTDTDTQASYTPGLDPQFKLGTLTNVDNDADREFVIIEFNALVDNSTVGNNNAGNNRNNTFSLNVNNAPYGPISATLQVRVSEPVITDLAKGVSPALGDAGDTVTYTVVFSNASGGDSTTAFDVNLTDTAPVKMTLNLLTLTTDFLPLGCSSLTGNTSGGNNIILVFGIVPAGCRITVTYQATLLGTVIPGEALINTANVTYTSLPGTGTSGNPTGSNTPGSSGADNGERNGSGTPSLNDYLDSDGAQVDVTAIQPVKTLIASSDALTVGSNLTIGEIGRYRMTILLAETTSPNFQIQDNLPVGMQYLDDGNTTIAFVSDQSCPTPTISSDVAAIGSIPWVCGNETTLGSVITTSALPASAIAGAPFGDGSDPTFNLGTITNSDLDANSEFVILDFNARVLNVATNQDAPLTTLDNTYTVFIDAVDKGTSGAASVTVVEPVITLDKQLSSITGEVDAGGVANYTITLTNNGSAPAYESNFFDILPTTVLDLNIGSIGVTFAGGASGSSNNSSDVDNRVDVVIDTIPVGGSATITYSAAILVSVTPAQVIQNLGTATWTSLSGTTDTNERTGSGLPAHNNYSTTDTASFTSAGPTIAKQLIATSSLKTTGSVVTIGEEITYGLLLTFPEGTTPADTVVDDLPLGLEVVPGSSVVIRFASLSSGGLTADFSGTIGTQNIIEDIVDGGSVRFEFTNDVVVDADNNTTNNTLLLRFRARVTNNANNLPGGTISNAATNQVGAGSPVSSNPVDVTLRGLEKTLVFSNVTSTTPNEVVTIGEILTYQVVLTLPRNSTDTAIITDTLDSGLAFVDCSQIMTTDVVNVTSSVVDFTVAGNCNPSAPINNPVITNSDANPVNEGNIITFNLGNIANNSGTLQTITLTYRVIVLDIASNVQNVTLDNNVVWTCTGGILSRQGTPSLRIVEPDLEIEKTVDPELVEFGSIVTFTIDISHTNASLATAYDVIVTDGIPTGLALVPGSIQVTETNNPLPVGGLVTETPTQFSVYWREFPLSATARVTFRATYVGPGAVINTASVEWSSLQLDPIPVPIPRATPLQPQSTFNTFSTERRYDPLNATGINNYRVASSARVSIPERLPRTGFAPGKVTILPEQPDYLAYAALGDLWLEIPKLVVKEDIVGVPFEEKDWNLTWLGSQAGYLAGSAYPTHNGNSALTAHAYLADGTPGPFAKLNTLSYGDQIIVHLGGQKYIYEVRENLRVRPDNTSVLKHEEKSWLTLITCQSYNEQTKDYIYRIAVRAVLVKVE